MSEDHKITVDGITRVDDPLDEFGTMLVHFRIAGDRTVFDMPIRVSRSLVPEDQWVSEAQGILHLIFTGLSRQTQAWSRLDEDAEKT